MGCTAVAVLAGGLLVATPAFAGTTDFATLQSQFSDSTTTTIDLTATINDQTSQSGNLVVGSGKSLTLTIEPGVTLAVNSIDLTDNSSGSPIDGNLTVQGGGSLIVTGQAATTASAPLEVDSGSTLTIAGSINATAKQALLEGTGILDGSGTINLDNSSDTNTHDAALEVDYPGALTVAGSVHLNVTGSTSSGNYGAGIGSGYYQNAGSLTFAENSVTTVTNSGKGAAVGGGYFGASTAITVKNYASVTAVENGDGAAIGGGSDAKDNGTLTATDSATVNATETGRGAAIGGGYLGSTGDVEIHQHAVVNATGTAGSGGGEAGIGDGEHSVDSGTINIDGYTQVTATGGGRVDSSINAHGGAAIGGSALAFANDTINIGGHALVSAVGTDGPGIGGQQNRTSAAVTIGSAGGEAQVFAQGGANGAGVGGGDPGELGYALGAATSVSNATLMAVGGATANSAVGSGTGTHFGTLDVGSGGVLIVPGSGESLNGSSTSTFFPSSPRAAVLAVPAGATATNEGSIVNDGAVNIATYGALTTSGTYSNVGTTTVSGSFGNTGLLVNAGTLARPGTGPVLQNDGTLRNSGTLSIPITDRNYVLTYDPQNGSIENDANGSLDQVTVYADDLKDAQLSSPRADANTTGNSSFLGWNTASDASGSWVDTYHNTESLSSIIGQSTGTPLGLRLYAIYQVDPVLPTTALPQAVIGRAYTGSVAVTAGTAPVTYSQVGGSLPAGLSLDSGTGAITGTPTVSGQFSVKITAANSRASATATFPITVVAAPLTVSAPSRAAHSLPHLGGSLLTVALGGLETNESYTLSIGGHQVLSGVAASTAGFTQTVRVPKSIGDGTQSVVLAGANHAGGSISTSIVTAAVTKHLTVKATSKPKAKHKTVVTVSHLYAGESVHISIKGAHAESVAAKANSKGVYVLTLKHGLPKKGKYTITATGAVTGRTAVIKLTVK